MMTYPDFPFTPGTPLYPSHHHLLAYHQRYASHHDLSHYIRFQHKVLTTSWVGNPEEGFWDITLRDSRNRTLRAMADHLIVASGNNHLPRTPSWRGQEEWVEAGNGRREILHSVYYREAERYANRTLLIIGAGASGSDAAVQTVGLTRRVRNSDLLGEDER
jgi:cation diffusion facilitator CzcD-associated flavoprotein CzcO